MLHVPSDGRSDVDGDKWQQPNRNENRRHFICNRRPLSDVNVVVNVVIVARVGHSSTDEREDELKQQ